MAPPKKNVKMDLGSFLADDTFGGGSWADEEVDLNTIGVSLETPSFAGSTAAPIGNVGGGNNTASAGSGFGSGSGSGFGNDEFKRERKEFPIPDQPPYRARVSNLPWEVEESNVIRHFEDRMQAKDIISDIVLPKDRDTGRLRGFAFVTFNDRALLKESLNLSMTEFQGRKIYVNVAAPPKGEDGDWRAGRSGSNRRGGEDREPAPELDWGAARNSQAELPPRQRSNRLGSGSGPSGESSSSSRPSRRQEAELDWGSARNSRDGLPPQRERSNRTPRKQEPEFDWNTARNTQAELPVRERERPQRENPDGTPRENSTRQTPRKQEPEFDWGAARNTKTSLPPRERLNRTGSNSGKKSTEPDFDWKRGQSLPSRNVSRSSGNRKDVKKDEQQNQPQKPQKSHFSVLNVEGEDEDEEEDEKKEVKESKQQIDNLQQATSKLTVSEGQEDGEGWEVVRK